MSTQIAVRLPDELLAFVDEQVSGGHATSRAALGTRALGRERRRTVATRDAEILAATREEPDDMNALAIQATGVRMPDLD